MPLKTNKKLKVYFSIKEVADMFGVNASLLRYWETVFPSIRPKTTGNKVRQYTQADIEEIKVIYNLVKVRGFKLDAAVDLMKNNRKMVDKTNEVLSRLTTIRDELILIKKSLGV